MKPFLEPATLTIPCSALQQPPYQLLIGGMTHRIQSHYDFRQQAVKKVAPHGLFLYQKLPIGHLEGACSIYPRAVYIETEI
jgi:hypothetical protein